MYYLETYSKGTKDWTATAESEDLLEIKEVASVMAARWRIVTCCGSIVCEGRGTVAKAKANVARRVKDQIYKDLGMTKVRGAMGGTYYE